MPSQTRQPTKSPSVSDQSPAHGQIRIAALAAAAEALKLEGMKQDKPAHPLPPCLKDVERQTD